MKLTFQTIKSKKDYSIWFHRCEEQNIPFVIIRKHGTLADVEWDCITVNPGDDEFAYRHKEFINQEFKDLIKYYASAITDNNFGTLSGYVKKLPIEAAEDFATDVCNTLSEAYKRNHALLTCSEKAS